jgi:hypothetical protein
MKKTLAILLIIAISSISPYSGIQIQASAAAPPAVQDWDLQFSADELDNLVAPIALYPDPLLAQVLLAATFPDQIDEAARDVRAYGAGYNVDSAPWDVSVKAVAHYPAVLSMMADKLDWTTSLGQAYVSQSTDVMDAVQRLRRQARAVGNLAATPQQEIVETDGFIYIYPAQARYIYVPVYDPAIVYVRRPVVYSGAVIWFGIGLIIGAWLNHDCDWGHHRVFYHGWYGHGPRWIARSRPYIHVTNVYVNNVYTNVVVNRTVINRSVNYAALNRYNSIHRDVDYRQVRRERGAVGAQRGPAPAAQPNRDNKIIRRNIDPNDPRINANRGHGQFPQTQTEARKPDVGPRPGAGDRQFPPGQAKKQPQITQPAPQQRGNVQVPRRPDSVFRSNRGVIDPGEASRRGQASRQEQNRPAPQMRSRGGGGQTPGANRGGGQSGNQGRGHGRGR